MQQLLNQAKYTVLYFYPKDNTPGCTIEAKEFSFALKDFQEMGAQVVGVSKDTAPSHCERKEHVIFLETDHLIEKSLESVTE